VRFKVLQPPLMPRDVPFLSGLHRKWLDNQASGYILRGAIRILDEASAVGHNSSFARSLFAMSAREWRARAAPADPGGTI